MLRLPATHVNNPAGIQVNFTVPPLDAGECPITVSISGKSSQPNVIFEIGP